MTDVAEADRDATRVIFSLLVNSNEAIDRLAELATARRSPEPDDDFLYTISKVSFSEDDWQVRADRLDEAVSAALDRLEATGVDLELLATDGVFVRAFFTFSPGAETISANLVARLARVHATIWIEADEV
ncbi:MAG TPA: hypothetical protein VN085_01715 [Vicinamibacterales bacterium]|nr:hypothetical protein [Vicinamibacterales bacterium]